MPLISESLKAKVQTIIDKPKDEMSLLAKWGLIKKMLVDANVAYFMEIHAGTILCHPKNRGGLGINHHNAHKNGATIVHVGADQDELTKATCFELSRNTAKRASQIGFNETMVAASEGMLAPVSGQERFLSVACGHTAAFCRAVAAGCTTAEETKHLLDPLSHRLNATMLGQKDPGLAKMLNIGWQWCVLPAEAEEVWPDLPGLVQSALNASINVASTTTELEAASLIAKEAATFMDKGRSVNWQQCKLAAAASEPPCKEYLDVIASYVELYGGGQHSPMVIFLDCRI